jgi:hypothetical protein
MKTLPTRLSELEARQRAEVKLDHPLIAFPQADGTFTMGGKSYTLETLTDWQVQHLQPGKRLIIWDLPLPEDYRHGNA